MRWRATIPMILLAASVTACDQSSNPGLADTTKDATSDSGAEVEPTSHDLVDNTVWTPVAQADDPWAPDPEGRPVCVDDALGIEETPEGPWYSVNTSTCGWLTATQPLLYDVPKGAPMLFHLWYWKFQPPVDPSTEFDLAIAIGDTPETLWEETGTVPTESGMYYVETIVAPRDMKAGETMWFHVSNHGSNAWELIRVSATF